MKTRTRALVVATGLILLGLVELVVWLVHADLLSFAVQDLAASLVGWGPFAGLASAVVSGLGYSSMIDALKLTHVPSAFDGGVVHLTIGLCGWVLGWVVFAVGLRGEVAEPEAPAPASMGPLHPRLATYVDLHWGTLFAYGLGIFLSEVGFIGVYMALVGRGSVQGGVVEGGLSPVVAFVVAFAVALGVAFAGGFAGAANSRRLSTPEATLALLYFGLPIPMLLTAMHSSSRLMVELGYRLREIVYLSSLLGDARPELGYWLITAALAVGLFLGLNAGFVATSSGRLDLKASYELFIATRHVAVFRPRLLAEVFLVLILGIVPPLLVWAIVQAAESVVERTRIRRLGLHSPHLAAAALNQVKVNAQTPTAMMTSLSVGGVGVGVMALIIVLSVMSGFEADLQKKILGTNAHGVVLKYPTEMPEFAEVMAKVSRVPGIVGATPFILNEVMVSSEGNTAGSMIKGIDPRTVGSVTDLPEYLLPGGELEWLLDPSRITARQLERLKIPGGGEPGADVAPTKPTPELEDDPVLQLPAEVKGGAQAVVLPGILIGRELAAQLKVVVGDRVNVISPIGGELGPQGPMPKSRPFKVAGIFYSGMYEYDSKFVYINLPEAQTFFNVRGATGLEVKVADVDNARGIMKAVYDLLDGYPYRTKDWGEMNRNLFSALRLEKLVMGIILTIIVIVAAGLIVATVIMLVLEKRKEIAVLKALGVPDGGIVKIFLTEGLQIGIAGGLLGLVAGLAWCLFIEKVGIRLDPQVYYIPALPVRIEPFQTVLSVVIAILVTFLASIYPALKASQVEPVDGLKSE
jgi:lipoprotein-releasing system permease protein